MSTESVPAAAFPDALAADPEDLFEVDSTGLRIDLDVAWGFLSTEAYWGRWRSREDFETQVANAWRLVGAYRRSDGAMVGFARATSDGASYAYLADVFVLPAARGHGLSKRMLAEMIERPPGNTFRWALHTADAHGLYEKFGFAAPNDRYLERPESR
ncbi:MAG TPA: GNAT family N-acetyltransferase [Kineosporiaceae bacterium]|nr:GNAT family N-acetyltransferase [Kineosporiaceae bacterium]